MPRCIPPPWAEPAAHPSPRDGDEAPGDMLFGTPGRPTTESWASVCAPEAARPPPRAPPTPAPGEKRERRPPRVQKKWPKELLRRN